MFFKPLIAALSASLMLIAPVRKPYGMGQMRKIFFSALL